LTCSILVLAGLEVDKRIPDAGKRSL